MDFTKQINKIKQDNSLAFLNILRFVACIMIAIIHHYDFGGEFFNSGFLLNLKEFAKYFVEMFFLISGMLFFLTSYQRLSSGKAKDFGKFTLNKIKRFYPIIIITTLFIYITIVIVCNKTSITAPINMGVGNLFVCLFFGTNVLTGGSISNTPEINSPLWYVTILLFCFLIAALLIALLKKRAIYAFLVPIVLGIAIRFTQPNYPFWNTQLGRGFVCFFLGIYLMMAILKLHDLKNKQNLLIIKLSLLVFSLTCIIIPFVVKEVYDYADIFFVFASIFGLTGLYNMMRLNKISNHKICIFLGKISFHIYAWSWPIFYIQKIMLIQKVNILADQPVFFFLNFLIHVAIGAISYFVFDIYLNKGFDRLGKIVHHEKQ